MDADHSLSGDGDGVPTPPADGGNGPEDGGEDGSEDGDETGHEDGPAPTLRRRAVTLTTPVS